MCVLGIDYGERRIGVSISDPTATVATALPTLKRRRGKRPPFTSLQSLATGRGVTSIVVGLPLALDGTETEWCAEVRRFGSELGRRLDLEVHYVDERMTSVRAERTVRSLGLRKREREQKERLDAAAAVLILQAWLDRVAATDLGREP